MKINNIINIDSIEVKILVNFFKENFSNRNIKINFLDKIDFKKNMIMFI